MKVLIIEDEEKIASFIKKGLESQFFAVDVAHDGEKGLYLAKLNDHDIVILDNLLPKKTGLEICREIRSLGKKIPILILSVQTDVHQKVDFLNAGADDYMMKPFSFDEVLARVRALLRRSPEVEADILSVDNLILDSRRHTVTRGDIPINLTKKEFMLLRYMLRNKGIVLSRAMIMEHVWDMNTDPFSNTIESHMLSLRKKINIQDFPRLISTIAGCGYKIEDFGT